MPNYHELTDYNIQLGSDLMLEVNDTHQAVFSKVQFFNWLCKVEGWHHDPNTSMVSIINGNPIFDSYRDDFEEMTTAAPIRSYDYFLSSLPYNERQNLFQDFVHASDDLDWVQVKEDTREEEFTRLFQQRSVDV